MNRLLFLLALVFLPHLAWNQQLGFEIKIMESELTIEASKKYGNVTVSLINNTMENLLLYHDFDEDVRGYPFLEAAFCDSTRSGSHVGLFIVDSNNNLLEVHQSFQLPSRAARRKIKAEIRKKNRENEIYVTRESNKPENKGKGLTPESLLVQRDTKKNRLLIAAGDSKENQQQLYFDDFDLEKGEYDFYLLFNVALLNHAVKQEADKQGTIFRGCVKSNRVRLIVK